MTPRRINQISVLLLLLGLGSAVAIYVTARPVEVDPVFGNPLNSKKYLHELRVMGGNANVAFAEFEAWLASRWQGRNLAGTVAFLSLAAILLFRFAASHPELFAPEPVRPATVPPPDPAATASSPPDTGKRE